MDMTGILPGEPQASGWISNMVHWSLLTFTNALLLFRVWKEFHNSSSKDKNSFQFTFPEFVRLVVNGTKKFAADEYMSQVAQVLYIIKKSSLWRFLVVF